MSTALFWIAFGSAVVTTMDAMTIEIMDFRKTVTLDALWLGFAAVAHYIGV